MNRARDYKHDSTSICSPFNPFAVAGTPEGATPVGDGEGNVVTRDLSHAILPGVTRLIMLEAMAAAQMKVVERKFTVAEAQGAREAFISSATGAAVPVVTIDGKKVGDGTAGPLTRRIHDLYATKAGTKTA